MFSISSNAAASAEIFFFFLQYFSFSGGKLGLKMQQKSKRWVCPVWVCPVPNCSQIDLTMFSSNGILPPVKI